MRDPDMRRWRALVRERAAGDNRRLSPEVIDELACYLVDLHAAAIHAGSSNDGGRSR
jgi:hypothetical protein